MDQRFGSQFSTGIEKLFSSGSVILFICTRSESFPLIFVSENAKDILGFAPSYFMEHSDGWSERIHPNDKKDVLAQFGKVINQGGGAINEYRFKTKGGDYIWLRDEIKVIKDEQGQELIYGSSIDITGRKKAEIQLKENKTEELREEVVRRTEAEKKLQKRLQYEKTISKCSKWLLESNSSEALQKSLKLLQEVTEVDRLFLYKNKNVNGDLHLDPVLEVTKPNVRPIVENLKRQFTYSDVPWFYEKLSSLQKVHAHIDDLPEAERSILQEQDVESILIVPFTVEDEWKGYIGFADTQEKRKWGEQEITLLETTSRIIAAYEKRKTIEKSLVFQRNYTKTILDSLPSIYLLMNTELELVQWNRYAEEHTGYEKQELGSKNAYDLIISEDHALMEEAVEQARKEMAYGTELHLERKSGKKVPYYWRGYFITLNETEYFLCVGINITQQKRVQMALQEEKKFTEGIIESLPGIFYTIDVQGNYIRWNKNFEQKLGYSSDEIKSMSPKDFYSEEEYQKIARGIEEAFEKGHNMMESTITTKSGEKVPYLLTANIIEQNGEKYLTGVGYDISEEIEARKKLHRSEKLFRNLFLKAPAGIVMVDPENKVIDINKSFEETFGYGKEELEGNDIDCFIVPKEERNKVPRMPLKKYASENFYREAKRISKSGDLVDVFIAAIPVYIDGEAIAGFGMYIDITEEKKYEKEISKSLKEKKTLLKEIHHRIKNNLAIVSGLLQLQMYESDDPVIRETLEESERRIQTMALIHEKLYNSDTLGHISCDSYITDLVQTIQNTIVSDQRVEIVTEIEDIKLDIDRAVPFALLVNEAVTNSLKYAFDDGDDNRVTIRIHKEDGKVYARIIDNGKGLPDNFSPEENDSLGMNLIDNFARQLEAEWHIASDEGTYVSLEFPFKK